MTAIRGISEIVLWVHDIAESLKFYGNLLGLTVISSPAMKSPLFLKVGEGALGVPQMLVLVQLPPGTPAFGSPRTLHHLALEVVPDLFDAEKARFEGLGLSVRGGQHPVIPSRTMYVTDPDGNEVEFICKA